MRRTKGKDNGRDVRVAGELGNSALSGVCSESLAEAPSIFLRSVDGLRLGGGGTETGRGRSGWWLQCFSS